MDILILLANVFLILPYSYVDQDSRVDFRIVCTLAALKAKLLPLCVYDILLHLEEAECT